MSRGTRLADSQLSGERVFANARDGFSLANVGSAQYPARTVDAGRRWWVDGPQVHIDAADAPEAVDHVGVSGPRELFAFGSSAIDVSSDGGRTWWETILGEWVAAVIPTKPHTLVAYVQESVSNDRASPAVTWQYVSRDGGRHWSYNTNLGGF